jgi:hypothetical protein
MMYATTLRVLIMSGGNNWWPPAQETAKFKRYALKSINRKSPILVSTLPAESDIGFRDLGIGIGLQPEKRLAM